MATKQATLFNLGGVVNIKQIKAQSETLQKEQVDDDEKIRILDQWAKKKPATDVLIEIGIGKTIKQLANSEKTPNKVKKRAKEVYNLWRAAVEKREALKERGPLDVQCDLDTQHWRDKAKRLIRDVIRKNPDVSSSSSSEALIESIERELFHFCDNLIQSRYRCSVRKIVFALKRRPGLRQSVFNTKDVSPRQLVRDEHA